MRWRDEGIHLYSAVYPTISATGCASNRSDLKFTRDVASSPTATLSMSVASCCFVLVYNIYIYIISWSKQKNMMFFGSIPFFVKLTLSKWTRPEPRFEASLERWGALPQESQRELGEKMVLKQAANIGISYILSNIRQQKRGVNRN